MFTLVFLKSPASYLSTNNMEWNIYLNDEFISKMTCRKHLLVPICIVIYLINIIKYYLSFGKAQMLSILC